LKYPSDLSNVKQLTSPNPDLLLGATLDWVDDAAIAAGLGIQIDPHKIVLKLNDINRVFRSFSDHSVLSAGVSNSFGLPQLLVERKSMSGESLHSCQHQLMGGLRCVVAAMQLVETRLKANLPVVALGLAIVGNYVEVWCMFQYDSMVPISSTIF
jgi:hypothetical protein